MASDQIIARRLITDAIKGDIRSIALVLKELQDSRAWIYEERDERKQQQQEQQRFVEIRFVGPSSDPEPE